MENLNRRDFLKLAGRVAAAMVVDKVVPDLALANTSERLSSKVDTEKVKNQIDNKDSIEIEDIENEGEGLTLEQKTQLLKMANELCFKYPGYLDMIKTSKQEKTNGNIVWGTAGYDQKKDINFIYINSLVFENQAVAEEVVTHEYGHLIYKKLDPETKSKIEEIFSKMEALETSRGSTVTNWFAQEKYVNGENIGYKGYKFAPNASELYPMAFSVLNSNKEKFLNNFYINATLEEKELIDELIKYMPKGI